MATKVQSTYQLAAASKAFPSNVTAGNLLTLRITWQGGGGATTLNSVTDSLGNTWTIHSSANKYSAALTQYGAIATCTAGTSGACTVTATLSTGTPKSIAIDEWNDAGGTLTFDGGNSATGNSSVLNSGSVTTTVSGGLGIALGICDASIGGAFSTPDSGWTDQQSYTSYWYSDDLYKLNLGAAGSVSAGLTLASGSAKNWLCSFVAFKVVAGGGGSPTLGKVNVSGTWKSVSAAYVKVSGAWKSVSAIGVKVSGAWKSLA